MGDELSYKFDLVLTDDSARQADPRFGQDVVELLEGWYGRIVNWVFPTIFRVMGSHRVGRS